MGVTEMRDSMKHTLLLSSLCFLECDGHPSPLMSTTPGNLDQDVSFCVTNPIICWRLLFQVKQKQDTSLFKLERSIESLNIQQAYMDQRIRGLEHQQADMVQSMTQLGQLAQTFQEGVERRLEMLYKQQGNMMQNITTQIDNLEYIHDNVPETMKRDIDNITSQGHDDFRKGIQAHQDQSEVLIQRRCICGNPPDYFSSKPWTDYENGFGDPNTEVWLGLKSISALTSTGKWQLRVNLEDFEGNIYRAVYNSFKVDSSSTYNLHVSGFNTTVSDVDDALSYHDGMGFSTFDRDNDESVWNCAAKNSGAWWYSDCHFSNLNGINYIEGEQPKDDNDGITWRTSGKPFMFNWPKVEMRIKRFG